MSDAPLRSPVGQYEPQVLMLAPKSGDDEYTLSLLSQFLEMGVALELDDNWRLPTEPPKDLSAYTACVFPESARDAYEDDLEAYLRGGGFCPYFRYYPEDDPDRTHRGVHHYIDSFGRDAYMFHGANVTVEAGLDLYHRDFAQTLMRRDVESMIAESRAYYFERNEGKTGPATSWGDPQYTQTIANFILTEDRGDDAWRKLVVDRLERFAEGVDVVIADHVKYQEIKRNDVVQCNAVMIGAMLMEWGHRLGHEDIVRQGVKACRFWLKHTKRMHGTVIEGYFRFLWSETMIPLPALVGLARFDDDKQCAEFATNLVKLVAQRNQDKDGLWAHWSDEAGNLSAKWSRGTLWPTLWLTQALSIADGADMAFAAPALESLHHTFEGLARAADPEMNIWRLVVDDHDTRIETSASAGLVFCHDRLRAMNLFDDTHDAMIDRAFHGLKRLWYHAGLASNCRGTSTGTGDYYRTRPMGYYRLSLMPATLAPRISRTATARS